MSAEVFVDTNILYYALTDAADPRHARARDQLQVLWQTPGIAAISVQVLQELHVNLLRKGRLSVDDAAQRVEPFMAWQVVDNDRALLRAAFEVQKRWKLSFWDSLIIAAAQRSGAAALWSEDLHAGQDFEGLKVINPLN